jgi:hypothetical protein
MKAPATAYRLIWPHATNAAAAVIHIGLLLHAVKQKSFSTLIFILIVTVTPASISVAAAFLNKKGAPWGYAQGLALIYMAFGAWAYYDTIYLHPDPQNGLVFIVVPILGFIATAIGSTILFCVFHRGNSPRAAKHDA